MAQSNRRTVCTLDHAGKQRDARSWNDQRYWLNLARRRKAALLRQLELRDRKPAAD